MRKWKTSNNRCWSFNFLLAQGHLHGLPLTPACAAQTCILCVWNEWWFLAVYIPTRKRPKTPKALIQCEFSLAFDFQLAMTIYSTAFRRAQNRTVSHEAHFGCFLTASGSDGANFKQREFPKIVEGFSQTLAFCTFAKCRTFLYFRKQTDKTISNTHDPMTR